MKQFQFSKVWVFVGFLLLANLGIWVAVWQNEPAGFGRLYFFDVGQGDGLYFRTPLGNDIVVDGGPGDVMLSRLGRRMPLLDRSIELLVLTHPHADHLSGLVEILKRYQVRGVIFPPVSYESSTYLEFLALLKAKNVKVIVPQLGQHIYLDPETVFDIYHPVAGEVGSAAADLNDASIVGKIFFGQSRALLMGDAGQAVESQLLQQRLPLKAAILKVGHHGSQHSSRPEFIKAVQPAYSVISVGKDNRYGHPHLATLKTLQEQGSKILRTDQLGSIAFALYPEQVILQNGR